ncbi:MAG: alternative ribosome rescue aminoacyl-tRNA hydrolase ArfB [Phycisphaerales bacterium]
MGEQSGQSQEHDGVNRPVEYGVSLAPGVIVRAEDLTLSYVRSSGPGGQNVNKRSTKAQLRIEVGRIPLDHRAKAWLLEHGRAYLVGDEVLLIESDETRSQSRNRQACMDKLRALVVRALVVPKVRRATKPTRGSVRRRLEEKKQRSETKRRRRPPED